MLPRTSFLKFNSTHLRVLMGSFYLCRQISCYLLHLAAKPLKNDHWWSASEIIEFSWLSIFDGLVLLIIGDDAN